MSTTFGSGISERCLIDDWTVCLERRNLGCHMVLGPESHGSTSIVKVPGGAWYRGPGGVGGHLSRGEKVRRKVVSPLRCLTVKDMLLGEVESDRRLSAVEVRSMRSQFRHGGAAFDPLSLTMVWGRLRSRCELRSLDGDLIPEEGEGEGDRLCIGFSTTLRPSLLLRPVASNQPQSRRIRDPQTWLGEGRLAKSC